jgi:hypothetical protein
MESKSTANPPKETKSDSSKINPPMENKSDGSKNNPSTGTKPTTSKSNHSHGKITTARTNLDKDLIEPLATLTLKRRGSQELDVPLNTLNLIPGYPKGIMQSNFYCTWSHGDSFKDIEEKIMNHVMIHDPKARKQTYLRIFTNKKMFDDPLRWYAIPFPSYHVVVHSHKEFHNPLDENKTGFVDGAVGIFVQNKRSMPWLGSNKGKIKSPAAMEAKQKRKHELWLAEQEKSNLPAV